MQFLSWYNHREGETLFVKSCACACGEICVCVTFGQRGLSSHKLCHIEGKDDSCVYASSVKSVGSENCLFQRIV